MREIPSSVSRLRIREFAKAYPFSSYPDYLGLRESLIIDKDFLDKIFPKEGDYKKFVRDTLIGKKYEIIDNLKID